MTSAISTGSINVSKRELAKHHKISLKTVENTYEQLLTEGYIYSEEKRGYFVMPLGNDSGNRTSVSENHMPFSIYQGNLESHEYFVDFTSNQAAIKKFPFGTWAKIMRNVLSEKESLLLKTVPSLQSINHNHRVIYLNTFSKTLDPSIRISYMVLPRKLMERYINTMNFYSCTVSAFEQYAMAEFMNKGYFERHIHRMKKYYKEKRDRLLKVLESSALKDYVTIDEKDAGNHFLMKLHTSLSDTELKWYARESGIRLDCLSEYCVRDKESFSHTIIVNYSDLEEASFSKALQLLSEVIIT